MNNVAFRYSGIKNHLINYINSIIPEDTLNWFYVESFLGSGTIFYNLSKQFRWHYLTDLDENIIKLHSCFSKFSYADYQYVLDWVNDTFGNIKEDKEAYYKLRNDYNCDTGIYKDIKLLMLANSCINSMLRFGPNGMNQSFGQRHYIISKECWNEIKRRLEFSTIKNRDYTETFKMMLNNSHLNWFVFLDPPYVDREMTYNKDFSRIDYINNLKELTKLKNNIKIVYSDIENIESDELLDIGFNKKDSKILRNTCPSSNKQKTMKEVLYLFNI